MAKIDETYHALLRDILENGVKKSDRTGTGTTSVFGRTIRHHMRKDGFPLLTTKKMFTKGILYELFWFMKADTNIGYLVDNGVHIWDGDAYRAFKNSHRAEHYPEIDTVEKFGERVKTDLNFRLDFGNLGRVYGAQWRKWNDGKGGLDQISKLIETLKTKPDDRRMMVTSWNPAEVENVVLPPCHYGFQLWTRELSVEERAKLAIPHGWKVHDLAPISHSEFDAMNIPKREVSLMWQQRSVDTFLGLPFNIASYGFLLEMIAHVVNMVPGELVGNLGDTHLYSNHMGAVSEQLSNDTKKHKSPTVVINDNVDSIDNFKFGDISLNNYVCYNTITAKLSN